MKVTGSIKISFILLTGSVACAQEVNWQDQLTEKVVVYPDQTIRSRFVDNSALHTGHWDTLPQPQFWMDVISLSPDSCILNIASCRRPIETICVDQWHCQTEAEKTAYKEYVSSQHQLDPGTTLFVTTGKKEFYEHKKMVPMMNKALRVFVENNTDPWYAQTILLIESPGKSTQKSSVGAYGPFQLMKSVARHFGLVVSKTRDDRSDLEKSAKAAAALLRTICIPKVKNLLDSRGIAYKESDLWFRLLVLHAYHAGAGNVAGVINKINPSEGGLPLITTMWQTEWGGFKNESQNYSQIALASLLLFDKMINQDGDTVFMVQGDVAYKRYKGSNCQYHDAVAALNKCIKIYENDLVDGSVSVEYFMKKVGLIQHDLAVLGKMSARQPGNYVKANPYPFNDEQLNSIGNQLLRKRKLDDAIKVFKLTVENYPNSAGAYDSLGRAYKMLGNREMALKYTNTYNRLLKGEELKP